MAVASAPILPPLVTVPVALAVAMPLGGIRALARERRAVRARDLAQARLQPRSSGTTFCSMAPNSERPSRPFISMRTVSPNFR